MLEYTRILGMLCVTLRENTEKPETVDVGANVLAGDCAFEKLRAINRKLSLCDGWKNTSWEGKAGNLILDSMQE